MQGRLDQPRFRERGGWNWVLSRLRVFDLNCYTTDWHAHKEPRPSRVGGGVARNAIYETHYEHKFIAWDVVALIISLIRWIWRRIPGPMKRMVRVTKLVWQCVYLNWRAFFLYHCYKQRRVNPTQTTRSQVIKVSVYLWGVFRYKYTVLFLYVGIEDPTRVLQNHAVVLTKCFQDSPSLFAVKLYSKGLISADMKDQVVQTPAIPPVQNAATLFSAVEGVIRVSRGIDRRIHFQNLCRVVEDHPAAGRYMKSMFVH